MELKVLGSGSATPQLERSPAGSVLTVDNFLILIDCGEGTQFRMLRHKVKISRLRYILISHLHGDHFFGLIGLLSTINMQKRTEPLTVFGPKGLDEIITLQLKHSGSAIGFPLFFRTVDTDSPEILFEDEVIKIRTFPLMHRIPCVGFRISKKVSKRKILSEKLPSNFPVPYYNLLKNGHDVVDALSGKTYLNSEFTTEGQPEKIFSYCSDTIFDERIIPFVENSDLLYHEATFSQEMAERAYMTHHSTASQAAIIASKAHVKRLILSHFSSRYKSLDHILEEARAVFQNSFLAEEGQSLNF
ncbi:MAG: ribonuclease Z [Bacteroidetes bacterium]|nr:ribonuclease Z [Bacteroidota bacterium]